MGNSRVYQVIRSFVTWMCLVSVAGCQLPRSLEKSDLDSSAGEVKIRTVYLLDGTEIDFRSDPLGYGFLRDSAIVRAMRDGSFVEIPVDSVQFEGSTRYPTGQENALQNLLIASGIIAFIYLLVSGVQSGDFH